MPGGIGLFTALAPAAAAAKGAAGWGLATGSLETAFTAGLAPCKLRGLYRAQIFQTNEPIWWHFELKFELINGLIWFKRFINA